MFITDTDLDLMPGLRDDLRKSLAQLNNSAKLISARQFQMGEHNKMVVRLRKPAFGASDGGTYQFAGGENFRIDNFFVTDKRDMAGLEISVTFCPAKPSLAMEIVSMTMTLDQAFHAFPTLEEWCGTRALLGSTLQGREQAHERAALDLLPTVAETRSSALWGVW